MQAGKLNKRIIIQFLVNTTDDEGYVQEEWINYKSIRARCVPVSATEQYKNKATNSKEIMKFNIRYIGGIDSTFRIQYNNKYFDIKGIENVGEANREMWLIGESVE